MMSLSYVEESTSSTADMQPPAVTDAVVTTSKVIPPADAAPFYYRHGKTGVLLIHGFTSTPYVFQEIGKVLFEKGYTVHAPLLSGHGTRPEDLELTSWRDWCKSADLAYNRLRHDCEDIFVLGGSFGANIACYLASRKKVSGIILIGTPWRLYKHVGIVALTHLMSLLGLRFYNKNIQKEDNSTELVGGPTFSYYKVPVKSVRELLQLMGPITEAALPKIHAPVLIIQSINDGLVKPEGARYFFKHLASADKQLVWISEVHHRLHTGKDKHQVFSYISSFLERHR